MKSVGLTVKDFALDYHTVYKHMFSKDLGMFAARWFITMIPIARSPGQTYQDMIPEQISIEVGENMSEEITQLFWEYRGGAHYRPGFKPFSPVVSRDRKVALRSDLVSDLARRTKTQRVVNFFQRIVQWLK